MNCPCCCCKKKLFFFSFLVTCEQATEGHSSRQGQELPSILGAGPGAESGLVLEGAELPRVSSATH